MNIADTIKNSTLFRSVDGDTIGTLAEKCHKRVFAKGCDIFTMGDKAESFFIIHEGWVKLYRVSKDGEEAVIHIFGPGESFAEAAVFNDTRTYPVNALALDEVTLIDIPRRFFVEKIEEDSHFALRMLGAIAARQHSLVQQIEQVTTRTAPQRIGAFLIRFCKKNRYAAGQWIVHLPYDKSVISTRMNIKPETFSRALAKLESCGVCVEKRKILITDMAALAEYCDISLSEIPC